MALSLKIRCTDLLLRVVRSVCLRFNMFRTEADVKRIIIIIIIINQATRSYYHYTVRSSGRATELNICSHSTLMWQIQEKNIHYCS